jgi:serine/threonine protein kinase
LNDDVKARRLPWQLRVRILRKVASALHHLHTSDPQQPAWHRDVKSANIALTTAMEPKVIDCGLGKYVPQADAGKSAAAPATAVDRLGLVVRELTSEERARRAADDAATDGMLLVERAQGAAGESGIQRGDLILGVNGKRTRSLKDFRDAVAKSGKVVALLVQRGDQQVFIPVRPG